MEKRVEIVWWAHACVEIKCCGKSLLIDPHDGGSLGPVFKPPSTSPDYILVTHEHYDHNAVEAVARSDTIVVRERIGSFELGPFRITGLRLPHDEFEGRLRGYVVAYRIEVDELKLTHLSDLGRPLTSNEAEKLRADVAFVPAGNVYTLHPKRALEAADTLGAKVVVPIHYWLPGMQLPLDPLDVLLRYAKKWRVVRHDANTIVLSKGDLPEHKTILVLSPPRF
ncbi:hypothetical protein PYJP_10590 [Pyrofollis japonicus]|uniref:MBL fold metallo-hydrolase n=1 Tax=Pyrofollis japonicus TaxID=3060460 RepID=UPI00295AB835|nr:MBL fold metallo-hydrolase [Pyrofollis japonicus]BEP17707.1 hypothetical protein PYJP_10590 [Pyrofollis japonicus]